MRVAGYVALMTDRYPPFSLDQGGHEPPVGSVPPVSTPPPPASPLPPALQHTTSRTGWTGGRVFSLILGCLLVFGAFGLASGGAALVGADQMARDADGFLTSPPERLATDGFAITSGDAHLHTDSTLERLPDAVIGDVRLSVEQTDGTELFVGIAPAADARAYLAGVEHDTLVEVRDGDPVYRSSTGGAPATLPTEQTFWVAEATGSEPELTWTPDEGDWTVVVMNADGSAAITADVSAGAEVPVLATVIAVLFMLAGLSLLLGAVLIAIPIRSINRRKS